MGIKGLWDLLKPAGQAINPETLRGKTLAVDISFWLHHAKYVSESKGVSERRAAVELIYRRILKLLHFGIRPIFVFDGPEASILKLPTLNERKKQRERQVAEKGKRNQNRALKNLARKALTVQLARDEGQRQHRRTNDLESSSAKNAPIGTFDDLDDAALLEALEQIEGSSGGSKESKDSNGIDGESTKTEAIDRTSSGEDGIDRTTRKLDEQTDRMASKLDNTDRSTKSIEPDRDSKEIYIIDEESTELDQQSTVEPDLIDQAHQSIESIDDILPAILSQCSSNGGVDFKNGQSSSQRSVDIVFTGSDHAHVLIRSTDESESNGNNNGGGFVDDLDRRREAVDRIRRLGTLEHLKTFRQHQQKRVELLASRLLIHEDEKRFQSSSSDEDESFVEVHDHHPRRSKARTASKPNLPEATSTSATSNRQLAEPSTARRSARKRRSNGEPSTSNEPVERIVEVESVEIEEEADVASKEKYTVDRWVAREEDADDFDQKRPNGSEIVERCRELLTYFGIPYVDSPAEAEAQCVHLESMDLVDGTITDDSDTWAFGARSVYRHFFERDKSVAEFRSTNLAATFGLDRWHFVALAIVLGCDFTPGVLNVGVVAALEILATFMAIEKNDGGRRKLDEKRLLEKLTKFRSWWETNHVDPTITPTKAEPPEPNEIKRRLRKLSCIFPSSFPDPQVVEIFAKPKVHEFERQHRFEWHAPDMMNLRRLLSEEFDDLRRVDADLADLRRRLPEFNKEQDRSQGKITDFYQNVKHRPTTMEKFEASSSKRLKNACEKLKRK